MPAAGLRCAVVRVLTLGIGSDVGGHANLFFAVDFGLRKDSEHVSPPAIRDPDLGAVQDEAAKVQQDEQIRTAGELKTWTLYGHGR